MENTRYKVLLIEDDKLDQAAFERLIETEGLPYDYIIAVSVSEAHNILASQKFDVVISDYLLGDGTAFDILDLVKNTPIIVVTGTGGEEIAVKTWRAGAYDYLTKDIEKSYLKALPITVENAIRHQRAEEKLRLLSGAVMSTVDSVYITDMNDKISFVNNSFCDTYGYKRQEILGKDSSVLWLTGLKTAHTRAVFRTQGVGGTWEVGFYHRRKDGSIFPVSLSRSIIKDPNGNKVAVVGTARDITEHILVEDELRRTNSKLKEQNKLKSELVIKVSEVLKRLLSDAVLNEVKNLLSNLKRTEDRRQKTDTVQKNLWKNLETARRIINDLLDISQIEAGKMKLKPTELSLSKVFSEVVEALSPLAEEKDITLKTFMSDSELIINADRDRIVQAFANLIGNSIESTPANGLVEVYLKDIGNEIVVEIQDDGSSIESGASHPGGSQMDKIFNGFEWIKEPSYWRPEQDRALSLMIAKKIVQMHGGWLCMESADGGRGNIFCISLPKSSVKEKISMAAKGVEISSEFEPGD